MVGFWSRKVENTFIFQRASNAPAKALATERGLLWRPTVPGTHIAGRLIGSTQLSSGRFAMLETLGGDGGLGFSLAPWQPLFADRIGQHISGLVRPGGGGEWGFRRSAGWG